MEELRIAFLVIGSVFIIGVLVHGIWKMRRQDSVPERQVGSSVESTQGHEIKDSQSEKEGFDEFGVGSVRVISEAVNTETKAHNNGVLDTSNDFSDTDIQFNETNRHNHETMSESELGESEPPQPEPPQPEPPMYASVVTQPKPHMNETNQLKYAVTSQENIPSPPEFLLKDEQKGEQETENAQPDFDLAAMPAGPVDNVDLNMEESKKSTKKRSSIRKRQEPTLGKDQMRIDFDEPIIGEPNPLNQKETATTEIKTKNAANASTTEVLVINVRASEDNPLSGAELLPLLLTLGFKFGEQDIFHRHVNANGKGPILFSLANMVKPGVFDIDNLETFTTQGISLFMVLPIDGEPHQVFNMMHNAARKIAEEFDAQLLDGRRSILTKQGIQQYVEKIREFERQRIISNSTR